ncbi:hypothetical protein Pmani_016395 [Petrolisthes manimaculis]|uniref:Uncharacterized protein n=1 Tax=Petrolisthes manimaculis TaxID=1843537 RepID=A0AAE1PSB9_9EUCA|nr:hypothetical protein Pmani_016395 [Petrolisthes manimaculis]
MQSCGSQYNHNHLCLQPSHFLRFRFLCLVYARIKDRRDVEKVGVIPLADNEPSDQYLYVLTSPMLAPSPRFSF